MRRPKWVLNAIDVCSLQDNKELGNDDQIIVNALLKRPQKEEGKNSLVRFPRDYFVIKGQKLLAALVVHFFLL
jgi:hypothetical protein